MEFNQSAIDFGVNLHQAAIFHLEFLHLIGKRVELLDAGGQHMHFAVQRYERQWLPLAVKYNDILLSAPLDIELIWHCHMLNPAAYQEDCCNVVGRLVDHTVMDDDRRRKSLQESRVLWRHEYPSVPFEADGLISPWFDSNFRSKLRYQLELAVERLKVFSYQVSLPHYRDDKYLSQAVLRYKKFLYLKRVHPSIFLVPCYDVDLIWHSHMLHPVIYRNDMVAIVGYHFNHDNAVGDRHAGSKFTVSDAQTRQLWKKVFHEPFSHSGAMFRGEFPGGKLYYMDSSDFSDLVTKRTTVFLKSLRLTGLPEQYQGHYKLKLWYNTGYQNFNKALYVSDSIATVRGGVRYLTRDVRMNVNFSFDTKYNDVVMVDLIQKNGHLCMGTSAKMGGAQFDMLQKIHSLPIGRGVTTHDTLTLADGIQVHLQWSMTPPVAGGYVLVLKPGIYQNCIMPETVDSMWGPIPLPHLPPGIENNCSVASHSLLNHTRRVIFTVRIIHSLPLMMSAVHVFFKDKMVAVGHLIGADQLPLAPLVKCRDRCVTIDIENGERALLLKNHVGDWGVVLGHWDGVRRPVSAGTNFGTRGISGEPGHLEIRFFKFSSRHWRFLSFNNDYHWGSVEHKFHIEAATVELDSGMIEIDAGTDSGTEVAENLALSFSVALLHVLCQPRPRDWEPRIETLDAIDGHECRLRTKVMSQGATLITAAGLFVLVPSNHLLRKRHREALEARSEEEARRRRQNVFTERRELSRHETGMCNHHGRMISEVNASALLAGGAITAALADTSLDAPPCADEPGLYDLPTAPQCEEGCSVACTDTGYSSVRHESLLNPPLCLGHKKPRMHRLPSIIEGVEDVMGVSSLDSSVKDYASERQNDVDCLMKDNVGHCVDMNCAEQDTVLQKPVGQTDLDCEFLLPIKDLPPPSDDLLIPNESCLCIDDDLPLPDVPDDCLIPEIGDRLLTNYVPSTKPQLGIIQINSRKNNQHGCDVNVSAVVGFDDSSAVGFEKYLDDDSEHDVEDHTTNCMEQLSLCSRPNSAESGNSSLKEISVEDFTQLNGNIFFGDFGDDNVVHPHLGNSLSDGQLCPNVESCAAETTLDETHRTRLYDSVDYGGMFASDSNYIFYDNGNGGLDANCGGSSGVGVAGSGDGTSFHDGDEGHTIASLHDIVGPSHSDSIGGTALSDATARELEWGDGMETCDDTSVCLE